MKRKHIAPLRTLRLQRGITSAELARRIGSQQGSLSVWEDGTFKRPPRAEKRRQIHEALELSSVQVAGLEAWFDSDRASRLEELARTAEAVGA